jgi:hypothetical protein
VVYSLVFGGAFHQSFIGILEHLIDVAHVIHLLLHLHQQLLLGVPKLLRLILNVFKGLL